jgi:aspartate aminotransferase
MIDAVDACVDAAPYEAKRNALCDALEKIGYDVRRPEGAFYVFQKTPIADDVAFVRRLAEEGVLAVPGTGFGRPGYIRLSLTVSMDTIVRAIPGFEAAFHAPLPTKS